MRYALQIVNRLKDEIEREGDRTLTPVEMVALIDRIILRLLEENPEDRELIVSETTRFLKEFSNVLEHESD